ncbi:MAG: hypothetical protein EHM21_06010 [Chloroflexi bacterium]|nr:MAG: hypothetical protein EHM21_06010 [Chloroflexota bacterium]
MSDLSPPPEENVAGRIRVPVRPLAILLMVAGAAGFFVSLLVYGEQVLCLLGSTLVTFVGLVIAIGSRRVNLDTQPPPPDQVAPAESKPVSPRKVPPGLRSTVGRHPPDESARRSGPAVQPPEPAGPAESTSPFIEPGADWVPIEPETLLDEVIAVLESQGAQVKVETQKENAGGSRGILRVVAQDGQNYRVLVLESGEGEVDVSDARALLALVTSSGSQGGYLVASAPFTQRAYDWASERGIRLVREDELSEISL